MAGKSSLRVIGFVTSQCRQCKSLPGLLDELARTMEGVETQIVDAKERWDLSSRFGVMSVPYVVVVEGEDDTVLATCALPRRAALEDAVRQAREAVMTSG